MFRGAGPLPKAQAVQLSVIGSRRVGDSLSNTFALRVTSKLYPSGFNITISVRRPVKLDKVPVGDHDKVGARYDGLRPFFTHSQQLWLHGR